MTCTTTIVLKRYVDDHGLNHWVAYLPSKPVPDVAIASVWSKSPVKSIQMLTPVVPALELEFPTKYEFSRS